MSEDVAKIRIVEYGKRKDNKGKILFFAGGNDFVEGISSSSSFSPHLWYYFDYAKLSSAFCAQATLAELLDLVRKNSK